MDHLSHTGRKIGRIKQDTEDALRRDIPEYPLIHRIRDVFDNVFPFEFEFDTPSTEHTSYLNLNFSPPPPPCQPSSENTTVVMGCFIGACDTYLDADTGSVLDTTYPFVSGTLSVYVNDVETTQYTITDTDTITLNHNTNPGDIVNIYYVYQISGCFGCDYSSLDEFNDRTLSGSWGSNALGHTWAATPTTNNGLSVSGGVGQIFNDSKTGIFAPDLFPSAPDLTRVSIQADALNTTESWVMLAKYTYTQDGTGAYLNSVISFRVEGPASNSSEITFSYTNNPSSTEPEVGVLEVIDNNNVIYSHSTASFDLNVNPPPPTEPGTHELRWEYTPGGTQNIYLDGVAVFTGVVAVLLSSISPSSFKVRVSTLASASGPINTNAWHAMQIDYIRFEEC